MTGSDLLAAKGPRLLEERGHLEVARADGAGIGKTPLLELACGVVLDHAGELVA